MLLTCSAADDPGKVLKSLVRRLLLVESTAHKGEQTMGLVTMKALLDRARSGGYAVPSFCVWNAESMQAVLGVALRMQAPAILMCGPGEFPLLSATVMGAVARAVAAPFDIPVAMHLDHGESLEQVRECLDAGFTSVMLDFSVKSFDENVSALRQAVAMAKPLGVAVEGEIGPIGRVDDVSGEGTPVTELTDPGEAERYVEKTGVDALAVSIGNAHGVYAELPQLDFDRLSEIRARVDVPLVLHGGSGTPEQDLRRAISLGIAKVNVASELIGEVRDSLREQWDSGRNLWTPGALAEAAQRMAPVVEKWIQRTGAEGQAAGS